MNVRASLVAEPVLYSSAGHEWIEMNFVRDVIRAAARGKRPGPPSCVRMPLIALPKEASRQRVAAAKKANGFHDIICSSCSCITLLCTIFLSHANKKGDGPGDRSGVHARDGC